MSFCQNCGRQTQDADQFCPSCGKDLRRVSAVPGPASQQGMTSYQAFHDPEVSTARTLTLVAIIIQLVFFAIGLLAIFALGVFFASTVVRTSPTVVFPGLTTTVTFSGFENTNIGPFVGLGFFALFAIGFMISIIWIVLDYLLIYRNLRTAADVTKARTPALILGIIQLIFGGVIPGILLIVAYLKIGESENNRRQMTYP